MVDLIYGRGVTDLIREFPFYLTFFRNIIDIKLFHKKRALYGSADIINVCNLHCTHCYWWLNREDENNELSAEDWRSIIRTTFKKQRLLGVTLVGGEPTMRPEVIDVFCQEMPGRVCVVTNGTFPLKRFENLYFTGYPWMEPKRYTIASEVKVHMIRHVIPFLNIYLAHQEKASRLGKIFG